MKLRAFEIRWAAVIGRALLPTGLLGGVVDDVDLGEAYRIECAEPPWYAALLLRFSLWLTWLAPPLVLRRFRTFGGLDPQAREAVLEKLLDSRIYVVRATATFLKLASCMLLMGHQRVLRKIGAYEYGRPEEAAVSKIGGVS
ncbi:MAG: hypothetical protein QOI66_792 [Myxococcales bacterium]|jgi:hypothetical protein|nr:hypothetical protein [Myxococcales bacterium]